MNPMGLMEMGQIKEQEHMREALRRSALREARKQAGVTWIQLVRARLFRQRDGVAAAAPATRPAVAATPAASTASAPVAPTSVAAPTSATPVLVHEIRIRQRPTLVSGGVARASAPAPQLHVVEPPLRVVEAPLRAAEPPLRVVEAAEPDCVGADC